MGRTPITRVPAPPIIKPGATDLTYTPEAPSLAAFTQAELGDAGTPADGFDASLSLVAEHLPSDLRGLGPMDGAIAQLASADLEVAGFQVDTDITDFGTVTDSGTPLLDKLNSDLTPPDPNAGNPSTG